MATPSRGNFFGTVRAIVLRYGVAVLILAAVGISTGTLEAPAWREVKKTTPELSAESLSESAGTGVVLGTLGGFRTVLADIAWLRAFYFWGQSDIHNCESLASLARTLDPQNYFFWENSVNYTAYDFPNWVISSRGGPNRVSEKVQIEIQRKAYENATKLIEEMAKQFPGQGKVWAFAAQMSLIKTEIIYGKPDFELALKYYMKAMESKTVPWFCFFAYGNIVKYRFPEKIPETRAYFEKRLATAKSNSTKRVIEDALAEFNVPVVPIKD